METNTAPVKRGRPKVSDEQKRVNLGLCGTAADLAFIETWNPGDKHNALSELVAELRRIRPGGRYSAPKPDPAAKLRPGTKTMLRREINELKKQNRALQAQIKKAGLVPVGENNVS